jgi:hypothetical protein
MSDADLSSGSVASHGSFEKRAKRIISQAGLFDLVQDMAHEMTALRRDLNRLMEHLGVPEEE